MLNLCPICNCNQTIQDRVLNNIILLKCSKCNFIYADLHQIAVEEVNSEYDEQVMNNYAAQKSLFDQLWFEKIATQFTEKLGAGSVLDVGCGDCHLLSTLKDRGWDCYGIDLSPWGEFSAKKHQITFHKGKIEDGCFADRKFDLVLSTSTLEHIYRPKEHVKAILDVTRIGGCCYFAGIPNHGSISVRLNMSDFNCNYPPGHVNYFTCESMNNMLNELKDHFSQIKIGTYGIPEVHKIYRKINTLKKRKTSTTNKTTCTIKTTDSSEGSLLKGGQKIQKFSVKTRAKFVVWLYYTIGKPFHLGDKLEIIVNK